MTQGGPLDATTTVVYQAVRTGYQQQQTGYASAISLVFFVLVLIVSLVQRYLTRDKDADDDRTIANGDAPRRRAHTADASKSTASAGLIGGYVVPDPARARLRPAAASS